jgi:hypothetical protein
MNPWVKFSPVLPGTPDTGSTSTANGRTHPVSATIDNLTLEQGLKRLLRSLNHTIIWEADKTRYHHGHWQSRPPAEKLRHFIRSTAPERTGNDRTVQ